MEETWSERARKTIGTVLKNYTDGGGDLVYLNSNDRKLLKKAIDDAYPFYERRCFPYKAWLLERRKVFIALDIPLRSSSRKSPDTGQLNLFSTSTKKKRPS
jgi:hypothetical protein